MIRAAARRLALALVGLGLCGLSAAAQEKVTVSGDGARSAINFDWQTPTTFSAEVFDGALIVRFGRPFEADLDPAVKAIPKLLLDATIRPDQRTAVFALRRDQTFRSAQNGNRITIELLDPSGQARAEPPKPRPPRPVAEAPRPKPPEPPPPAPAAQVRLGQSEAGTRLEIDWGRPVKAERRDNGRNVALVFDQPGRLDLGDLKDRALKLVEGIDTQADKASSTLSLTLADKAQLRQSQDGNHHILDILPAPEPKAAEPRPAPKPEPKPEQKAEAKPAAPPPALTMPPAEAPTKLTPATPAPPPAAPPAVPPAVAGPVAAPVPSAAAPAATAAAAPAAPCADAALAVAMQVGDGKVTLRFPWCQPVGAAAFRRGDQIWIAFDRPAKLDIARLGRAPATFFTQPAQLAEDGTTVLRLNAPPAVNPSLALDGAAWQVELRHQPVQPETPIAIEAKPMADGKPGIALTVSEPGKPAWLRDPEVGDRLVVVPVQAPGHGVAGTREYAEFRLLATAQGIAIELLADRPAVDAGPGGVTVSAPGGLMLSSNSDSVFGAGALGGPRLTADQELFDFKGWARGGEAEFLKNRQALNMALANASPESRNVVRLDNARFYFAHLMPQDALGAIERIEADGDAEVVSPQFRALKGAVLALARRGAEAEALLADGRLAENREAKLWRGLAAAQRGQFQQAHALFAAAGPPPQTYPLPLRQEMGLKALEAAIAAKEPKLAAGLAETLGGIIKDGPPKSRLDYLRGRVLADLGKREDALKLWREVVQRREPPAWPRAELALIESGLATKTLKPEAAIERLERLRYSWRGDDLERRVLELLGQLNLEGGSNAAGLAIYRELATLFPDSPEARNAAEAMTRAFVRLFVEGESDGMPPLKALALYDQFRELTPSGARGDAVIRNLADRLASIDLLDRAAELLDDLARNRLTGDAKAEAGRRLAQIRLQNGQAEQAIAALDQTSLDTAPEALKRDRARIRAQALLALDKPGDALQLLAQDESAEADRLRQDIYWKQADWPQAAKVAARRAEQMMPQSDKDKPSDEAARTVMNAAVASSLAGDRKALAVLRDRYGKAMDQTVLRSAFRLIANGSGSPGDLAEARRSLENVQGFQQFLNSTSPSAGGGAKAPAANPPPASAKPAN